jgi:L-arabinose isomerase
MADKQLRVGLCGIGLAAYWPQFEGLRSRLEGYVRQVAERLETMDVQVEELGMVDTAERGREAGKACRRADVDLLIIYVTTYALSNTLLPMVQRAKTPMLLLSLQPEEAIDYEQFNRLPNRTAMTGEWLVFCSACPVPEIANVMLRANLPFHQVTGVLGDEATWAEITEWIDAARVKKALAENRLGLMGQYYSGMLDIMTDLTQVAITFGSHIEHLEVDELSALRANVSESEVASRIEDFRSHFEIQSDCAQTELARAARTSIGLDRLVEKHDLQSLAYYASGRGVPQNEDTMSSIILGTSLLTARGIPVAGEYEVKNVLAMKIMDCLGAGGSFSEYYALDLKLDHVLMGHDGPGHLAIAETKTKVRPLDQFHGKSGSGLSVEMSVKHGPVTLLSVVEDAKYGFKILVAEGESVAGEVLRIGNTNSHYRFPIGARGFVKAWNEQGPAHHCAIGLGHISARLSKLAQLLAIPMVRVC